MQHAEDYELDPNFAILCSFFEKFGPICSTFFDAFNISEFTSFLEAKRVSKDDIYVKIISKFLVKIGTYAKDWEQGIKKFCKDFPERDDLLLNKTTFCELPVPIKLRILKNLCEDQFEFNDRFNAQANELLENGTEIRHEALGTDRHGRSYWLVDSKGGSMRMFRGWRNGVTLDETWNVICRDLDDFKELINMLKESNNENEELADPPLIVPRPPGSGESENILPLRFPYHKPPKHRSKEKIMESERNHKLKHCYVRLKTLQVSDFMKHTRFKEKSCEDVKSEGNMNGVLKVGKSLKDTVIEDGCLEGAVLQKDKNGPVAGIERLQEKDISTETITDSPLGDSEKNVNSSDNTSDHPLIPKCVADDKEDKDDDDITSCSETSNVSGSNKDTLNKPGSLITGSLIDGGSVSQQYRHCMDQKTGNKESCTGEKSLFSGVNIDVESKSEKSAIEENRLLFHNGPLSQIPSIPSNGQEQKERDNHQNHSPMFPVPEDNSCDHVESVVPTIPKSDSETVLPDVDRTDMRSRDTDSPLATENLKSDMKPLDADRQAINDALEDLIKLEQFINQKGPSPTSEYTEKAHRIHSEDHLKTEHGEKKKCVEENLCIKKEPEMHLADTQKGSLNVTDKMNKEQIHAHAVISSASGSDIGKNSIVSKEVVLKETGDNENSYDVSRAIAEFEKLDAANTCNAGDEVCDTEPIKSRYDKTGPVSRVDEISEDKPKSRNDEVCDKESKSKDDETESKVPTGMSEGEETNEDKPNSRNDEVCDLECKSRGDKVGDEESKSKSLMVDEELFVVKIDPEDNSSSACDLSDNGNMHKNDTMKESNVAKSTSESDTQCNVDFSNKLPVKVKIQGGTVHQISNESKDIAKAAYDKAKFLENMSMISDYVGDVTSGPKQFQVIRPQQPAVSLLPQQPTVPLLPQNHVIIPRLGVPMQNGGAQGIHPQVLTIPVSSAPFQQIDLSNMPLFSIPVSGLTYPNPVLKSHLFGPGPMLPQPHLKQQQVLLPQGAVVQPQQSVLYFKMPKKSESEQNTKVPFVDLTLKNKNPPVVDLTKKQAIPISGPVVDLTKNTPLNHGMKPLAPKKSVKKPVKRVTIVVGKDGVHYDKETGKPFEYPNNGRVIYKGRDGYYYDKDTGLPVDMKLHGPNSDAGTLYCVPMSSTAKGNAKQIKYKSILQNQNSMSSGVGSQDSVKQYKYKKVGRRSKKKQEDYKEDSNSSDNNFEKLLKDEESEKSEESDPDYDYEKISRRVRAAKQQKLPKVSLRKPSTRGQSLGISLNSDSDTEPVTLGDMFPIVGGQNAKRVAALKKHCSSDDGIDVLGLDASDSDQEVLDETPCTVCNLNEDPQTILLCDDCNASYHLHCLSPPLVLVPLGDWYCPECEHEKLLEQLTMKYQKLVRHRPRGKYGLKYAYSRDAAESGEDQGDDTSARDQIKISKEWADIDASNIVEGRSSRNRANTSYNEDSYFNNALKDVSMRAKGKRKVDSDSSTSESESNISKDSATISRSVSKRKRTVTTSKKKKEPKPKIPTQRKVTVEKHEERKRKKRKCQAPQKKQRKRLSESGSNASDSEYECSDGESSSEDSHSGENEDYGQRLQPEDPNQIYYTSSGRKTNCTSRLKKMF